MSSPDYFEFFSQAKIMSGNKALANIPVELDGFDARKPLVITSQDVTCAGLGKKFIKALYDSNVVIGALFDNVPSYAGIDMIQDLAGIFKDRGCDSVIAIGGGAAAEIAKAVNVLVSEKTSDLFQFEGENKISGPLKPFFYVSTSRTDGYEVTNTATVEGRVLRSNFLFPDVICIDKSMVGSGDPCTVFDSAIVALTHSIEACAAPNNNPVADAYAHAAIQFIYENVKKGVRSPGNKKTGAALANAAAMGAVAFSNAPSGMVHLLSCALAEVTDLSEALCMSILLPHGLELMQRSKNPVRGELLLALAGLDTYSATVEKERPYAAIGLVKNMITDAGLKNRKSLKDLNVVKYKLNEAAKIAVENSAKSISMNDCMTVLENAWEGKTVK